jgi:cellulose synthase/poly-beta-1,6-N-acetylglucosamine synthase-like glycosyltransferase
MELLFWLSLFLVLYIYIGYPLLIKLFSVFTSKTNKKISASDVEKLPSVSILIAAYNEEKDIKQTLLNKIALDYPEDKLEILVVSDESTDATDEIVEGIAQQSNINIRLFRQIPRKGKTAGLNIIVPEAKGEIIVFSDANSIYGDDALLKLVSNFNNEMVGYVTGKMVYTNPDGSLVGDGCSSYMKYENWMREVETQLGSIVGVDGGIDAMRKKLYESLRDDQLPDFVQPLKVVEKGYRVVYESGALLKEEALSSASSEYVMRVRVTLRALWALKDMRTLFNPFRFGMYSFQLFSHKLLRYLAFVPIISAFALNVLLCDVTYLYSALMVAQVVFYMLALRGKSYQNKKRNPVYFALPYYFTLLNVACMHAFWRFIKGEKQVIWKPRAG